MARTYKRDALGRFASTGAVAGVLAGASAGAALSSKTARRQYIPGSLKTESRLHKTDGTVNGATVGARFAAPRSHELTVSATVRVTPPKRQPPTKAPTVASAAEAATRQSASAAGRKATNGRSGARSSAAKSSAGRKVRR